MGNGGSITVGAGEIQAVGIHLIRVFGLLLRQIAHQRIGFTALARAVEVFRQTIGYPDAVRVERQTLTLNLGGLRPLALALKRFRLLFKAIVSQAAFNIINAATLCGG